MERRSRASPVIKIASPACDPGRGVSLPGCRSSWNEPGSPPGAGCLAYVCACCLFALTGIDMAVTRTQRKQHETAPLPDYRVWQAG
jgi:hypothetical protein